MKVTREFHIESAGNPHNSVGLTIDYNQLLVAKSDLFEGRNSKNGEINVFFDCIQLILMGFLTTSLHKNS